MAMDLQTAKMMIVMVQPLLMLLGTRAHVNSLLSSLVTITSIMMVTETPTVMTPIVQMILPALSLPLRFAMMESIMMAIN